MRLFSAISVMRYARNSLNLRCVTPFCYAALNTLVPPVGIVNNANRTFGGGRGEKMRNFVEVRAFATQPDRN